MNEGFLGAESSFQFLNVIGLVVACAAVAWIGYFRPSARRERVITGSFLICGVILSIATFSLIEARHPYLNPFNPDRITLGAERAIASTDNKNLSEKSGCLFAHSERLIEANQFNEALHYLEAAFLKSKEDPEINGTRISELIVGFMRAVRR